MADISRIQDLTGSVYDLKDTKARGDIEDLAGNLLPAFCDFPTRGGPSTKPVTVTWNTDRSEANIRNSEAVSYANYIGLYDPLEFVMPAVLDYDTAYLIHFSSTDPNVTLCIDQNGSETNYSGDATLTVTEGQGFTLSIKIAANALVDATVAISMPSLKSFADLQKDVADTLDAANSMFTAAVDLLRGGSSGEMLKKNSGSDLDLTWGSVLTTDVKRTAGHYLVVEDSVYDTVVITQSGSSLSYYTDTKLENGTITLTGAVTNPIESVPSSFYMYSNGTPCEVEKTVDLQDGGYVLTFHRLVLETYYTVLEDELNAMLAEVEKKGIPSGGTSGQYIKKFSGTELDFDWSIPDANEITWLQTKQIPVINEVGAYNYHQWAQGSATGVPWTYYTSFSLSGNDIVFHGQTTTSVIMIPSEAYDYYDNNGTIIPCKIVKGTKMQNTVPYITLGYYAITGFTTEQATYTNGTVAKTLNDYETRIAALETRVATLET